MGSDRKPKILIVDDEPSIVDTITYVLHTEGFDTVWAATGPLDIRDLRAVMDRACRRQFSARIYELAKSRVNLQVYVTDARGMVIYDSDGGRREGQDYSRWNDVLLTLRGEYGARASRLAPDDFYSTVLYVAAPVMARKGIALANRLETPLRVQGEAFLLQQAIGNLVQNAVDFTPAGGTVTVAGREEAADVEFTVSDTGPGIPDYALDRVFDRFYSLQRPDTRQKSSGLGLSIVHEVALLHGGSATLANHPAGGAVATLRLPARKLPARA